MAKQDEAKSGKAANAKTDKVKKVVVKKSVEELKKTQKGRIILTIRKAMEVANLNERTGLTSIDKKGKDGNKQLAGRMNGLLRNGGKIESMDEKSENYTKLKDLATKALPELTKQPEATYGNNTKAILNFCIDTLSAEKGPRKINAEVLQGMVI